MRPHSGIPKKVREAEIRKQRTVARRFNEPLRIFLERKYPNVLKEFQQLYEWLDKRNPDRKNLTLLNTSDFKQWELDNPPPMQNFSGPPTLTRLSPPLMIPNLEIPLLNPQVEISPPLIIPNLEIPQVEISPLPSEDILSKAWNDVFGPVGEPIEEPIQVEDLPAAIINELMEDNYLRELLNTIPEELPELRDLLNEPDEGIELNHVDEILEDIVPFDFAECELF